MTSIESIVLEVPDPAAAEHFYAAAFGLGDRLRVRPGDAPASGFRGFTVSLVVAQPSTVDSLIGTAVHAGARTLRPVKKSFWGYGGVVQAPDGAIWKIATSAKKDTGPATREVSDVVLLIGAGDVRASKQFYVARGLAVAKSFGARYVEFDAAGLAGKTCPLQPACRRQGRRRARGRDRGAPDRHRGRWRAVHGPGRVCVGDDEQNRCGQCPGTLSSRGVIGLWRSGWAGSRRRRSTRPVLRCATRTHRSGG